MASDMTPRLVCTALAVGWFWMTCAASVAQTPPSVAPAPALERYLLQVEVPLVAVYREARLDALVIGRLEQGVEVAADRRNGDWYRIELAAGGSGRSEEHTLNSSHT